jgi:hypothetical protein
VLLRVTSDGSEQVVTKEGVRTIDLYDEMKE